MTSWKRQYPDVPLSIELYHLLGANAATLGLLAVVGTCPGLMAMSPRSQALLLVLSGAFFGMPHGALDGVLLWGQGQPGKLARDFALYVALAGAMTALWLILPPVALVLFLGTAVFHWGEGDREAFPTAAPWWLDVLGRGGIFFVCFWHRWAEVEVVLQLLVGPQIDLTGAVMAIQLMEAAYLVAYMSCLGFHMLRWKDPRSMLVALELVVLYSAFCRLPALVALPLYYCVYHSTRHYIRVPALTSASRGSVVAAAVFFTALSLVLIAIFYVAEQWAGMPGDLSIVVKVGIIGVSAMTCPHLVVVHLAGKAEGKEVSSLMEMV